MPYDLNNEGTKIHANLKQAEEDLAKATEDNDKGLMEYYQEAVDCWTDSLKQLPAINWLGLCQD